MPAPLPNLERYLATITDGRQGKSVHSIRGIIGIGAGFLAIYLLLSLLANIQLAWQIFFAFAACSIGYGLWSSFGRRSSSRQYDFVTRLAGLSRRLDLRNRMHPRIAEALESCAQAALAANLAAVRGKPSPEFVAKIEAATRSAMEEAIHISAHHIRWEAMDSKTFRRHMEADPEAFEVTGAIYAIRDRLRRVTEELGEKSFATTHLDSILEDLAARKAAERELDQNLHHQ